MAAGAVIFLTIAVFWMLLDNACTFNPPIEAEKISQCYTRWIDALGGWFAGAAAFFTLVLIGQTLVEAQTNNKLMAKQTRTVTGELDPVFNHNGPDTEDSGIEIFRFWNHHRRAITIDRIELIYPEAASFTNGAFEKPGSDDFTRFVREDFKNSGRTIAHTIFAKGTPVGASCEPITFKFAFTSGEQPGSYVNIHIRVRWRFRDANMTDNPPAPLECHAPVSAKPWVSHRGK